MSITQRIKEYALDIGYSNVGITNADDFESQKKILLERNKDYDFYLSGAKNPLLGTSPKALMPEAKSIISLVYDYGKEAFPEYLQGKIGRAYQSRSYNVTSKRIAGARHELMRNFLLENGFNIGENILIPERLAAARAGIVTLGRNNCAYTREAGSFIILSSFIVDVELEYDNPTVEAACPNGCNKCIEACPTGALYAPNALNPKRCIGFNHWKTQDDKPGCVSSHIPRELRNLMGTWYHGCDKCQEVCPMNQKRLKANLPKNEFLFQIAEDFNLENILNMSDSYFENNAKNLLYCYIDQKKYFQRNAAIAIGNTQSQCYLPALDMAMNDPEPLVREYAAWALGRIGGGMAEDILRFYLANEKSQVVLDEINSAIAESRKNHWHRDEHAHKGEIYQ